MISHLNISAGTIGGEGEGRGGYLKRGKIGNRRVWLMKPAGKRLVKAVSGGKEGKREMA